MNFSEDIFEAIWLIEKIFSQVLTQQEPILTSVYPNMVIVIKWKERQDRLIYTYRNI